MSSRAKKWLVFGIIVVVIAGAVGISKWVRFQKFKIPDDAVLGNLDVVMVQIEPEIIRSMWNDNTAESTTVYVFRPDGSMSIGSLDLDVTGGFLIPNPGSVYFIKENQLYCCSVIDRNWRITDRKTWQAYAIFELRDKIPYISDNYKVNDVSYAFIEQNDIFTREEFITQVHQKIAEYQNSR